MALALSAILNQTLGEIGLLPLPSAYVASTDPAVLQYVYLANASATRLRRYGWNYLIKQGSQALTTGTQDYALPSDFWCLVPDSMLQNGTYNFANMPASGPQWAAYRSTGVTGLTYQVRIYQNKFQVQGATTGDTLNFEYLILYPITDSTSVTGKQFFTVDTDLWKLDDALLIADLKWRIKKEKGFDDWQVDLQEFSSYRDTLLGREAGAQTIVMGGPADYTPPEPYTDLWV